MRASTTTRKQETVERLRTAIESLKGQKLPITAQSIYAECGLHYSSYVRNEEAITLFRANSTHLNAQKKRSRRKHSPNDETTSPPRDSYLNYKKPQLVARLRKAESTIQDLEYQLSTLADAYLLRETRVSELEAKLATLEPYKAFVEQVRQRVRQEEHGNDISHSS
ncbi:hypothetical protein [Ktedonobacter robiniae]|uniref:hypothetical protein n=1 Tax=Ktedonobacter robiniae TaxID=2778365 RepID=UPI001914F9CB|nr:hypothetical protein [Ktedonobacter robiniae]